jgi:hypothetical protein
MWPKWIFGKFPKDKILKLVKEEGTLVGERQRNGRKVYTYLLKDFFVQVMFIKDNPSEEAEHLETFENLVQLNSHLEKEFRTAF